MILTLDAVIDPDDARRMAGMLESADWRDGRITAGYQSALAKNNRQLAEGDPLARALGAEILAALASNLVFQSAALPASIFPPLFNRYGPGQAFGTHIDNALRPLPGGGRLRTDLSATLFLSDPAEYDGGELVIEDATATQSVKLPAGHMVLYPATTLHRVAPVSRGVRVASFFWVQSYVADAAARAILFDIDMSMQALRQKLSDDEPALIALTGAYHNLLRRWAEA